MTITPRDQIKMMYDMVTDAEIADAWLGNFGPNPDKRKIIADTLLKIAGDFSTGSTSIDICQRLGLLSKRRPSTNAVALTKKGRRYLFWAHTS